MKYRIATVAPSVADRVEHNLTRGGITFVYPKHSVIRRQGRERLRVELMVALLPGVFFIPDSMAYQAELSLETEHLRLWWMKNPASDKSPVALCSVEDLEFMLHWIEEQKHVTPEPAREQAPARKEPIPVGTSVTIQSGPLTGIKGVVTSDDGQSAVIEVGFARISLQIWSCSITPD